MVKFELIARWTAKKKQFDRGQRRICFWSYWRLERQYIGESSTSTHRIMRKSLSLKPFKFQMMKALEPQDIRDIAWPKVRELLALERFESSNTSRSPISLRQTMQELIQNLKFCVRFVTTCIKKNAILELTRNLNDSSFSLSSSLKHH